MKYNTDHVPCGVWIPPGWEAHVEEFIGELHVRCFSNVGEIKEKFGGLRIYMDPGTCDDCFALADEYEVSCKFCQECGVPTNDVKWVGSWLAGLWCEECYDSKTKERSGDPT